MKKSKRLILTRDRSINMAQKELGIIGIGNMGSAILKGLLDSKIIDQNEILIFDINEKALKDKEKEHNIQAAKDNKILVQNVHYLLLAVKPQVIDNVLKEITPHLTKDHILVSIAAGISIDYIQNIIQKDIGIVRVMPNTPALVNAGISAIAPNKIVKPEDLNVILEYFKSIGEVVSVEEKYIDAVTGLSGSGPAYIFIIIEALADGGVKMGLTREIALKLAAQTVLGSAKMVLETGKHPGELKDMVTSPGGTTITALHMLERGKLRGTLISAVEAATLKSKSLK